MLTELHKATTDCIDRGPPPLFQRVLDARANKITRRPGNAKPQYVVQAPVAPAAAPVAPATPATPVRIRMPSYHKKDLTPAEEAKLVQRPIVESSDIMGRVRPILEVGFCSPCPFVTSDCV